MKEMVYQYQLLQLAKKSKIKYDILAIGN